MAADLSLEPDIALSRELQLIASTDAFKARLKTHYFEPTLTLKSCPKIHHVESAFDVYYYITIWF